MAAALYYLINSDAVRQIPDRYSEVHRPDVLFAGAVDHVELGSAIRSAAALGWRRVLLDDANNIWFAADRHTIAEGRAAARSARSHVRVVPYRFERSWDTVTIVSMQFGKQLMQSQLARGKRQLVVIPDETAIDIAHYDWEQLAPHVEFARIEVRADSTRYAYHYRLPATITLAEIARQLGTRSNRGHPGRLRQVHR